MQTKNTLVLAALATCVALTFSLATFAAPAADPTATTAPAPKTPAKALRKKTMARIAAPVYPDIDGFYNSAQTSLGAIATASGVPINKDWPGINAIQPDKAGVRGGVMMGSPLKGGRLDIKLGAPCDIHAIETVGLDYNGTLQPKAIDIYIDNKMVKHADLPETPGQPVRIDLDPVKGQNVGILITDEYPRRTLPNGKLGPNYGGWARIRVLTTNDLSPLMKVPAAYQTKFSSENISPTSGALADGKVEVYGEPRADTAHPNTIWDQQDINHYKEMLKTSKDLQTQLANLKRNMDVVLTRPIDIPQPKKDADGKWMHLSDATDNVGARNNARCLEVANLATVYALTGEEKYGDFAKKILLAYADVFNDYGVGARPGFAHDPSKVYDQRLGDATWLILLARGYDLIYNLPSMTPAERKHIQDDLLINDAKFITGNHAALESPTNWSAIETAAVLITGYATDDQDLIDIATYGLKGTKEKPTGGFYLHFSNKTIADDGMWSEGSTGYQFMAMEALVCDAEVLWHHGIDMYRYRDAALKKLFDSPIKYAYADLQTPAVSDGGGGSIIGYESNLWEFGYERYRDPAYLAILNQIPKTLRAEFQKFPVSILFDEDFSKAPATAPDWKSINLFSVGMGILRLPEDPAMSNLTFLYGKPHSHGHPDKLTFDLYALGGRFMPDPGSVWYENPIYHQWYHTTLAHNSLVVDQQDELPCTADLLVFAPARTMGMQRGSTDAAYPGVTLDRSLFFTPQYLVDIYGAFGQIPHTMDLSYHFLGDLKTDLNLEKWAPDEKLPNAYDVLLDPRHASTKKAWSGTVTAQRGVGRVFVPGGIPTDVIIGGGYMGINHPPAVIQRRDNTKETVYANAIDISGGKEPYIKAVSQEGSLNKGYGLLTVDTVKGKDLCFTAFRPGDYKVGDLETDAQQATVLRDGNDVRAMYLAGGTNLKVGDISISRNEPGLAYIEKSDSGNYIAGNPSPKEATVTIAMPALDGLDAFNLDAQGKRTGPASIARALADAKVVPFVLTLPPLASIEFSKPGAPSTYEYTQAAGKKRMAEEADEAAKAKADADARSKTRVAEAAANPLPANTVIVVQAENFTAQGNGQVTVTDAKTATVGKAILNFNDDQQYVEWTVDAPAAGYYNLSACYCTIDAKPTREISVNGIVQEPNAPLVLPSTGGFSNGSDDWQIATAQDPSTDKPLLIKLNKGKNTLRLTGVGSGASNLDYLLLTSPDVKPTRTLAKP